MIKPLSTLILALLTGASASVVMEAAVPAAGNARNLSGLEQYVYPANRPATVACPAFTADGLHFLSLSDDGKKIGRAHV